MTTSISSFPTNNPDDASFRVWGGGISAQLAAAGFTRASDTGQINWATATRPAAGASGGYEVYRFNDSLQATKPIFIKLSYESAGFNQNYPVIRVTVGTATNGAGVISGIGSTNTVLTMGSSIASPSPSCYCCASPSRLYLVFAQNPNGGAHLFIERSKDASGQYTGDGWFQLNTDQFNQSTSWRVVPYIGPESSFVGTGVIAVPPTIGVSSLGNKVVLSPVLLPVLAKPRFASLCVAKNGEIGSMTPFTMTHLGAVHTFMTLPLSSGVPVSQGGATGANCCWAIPWE